MHTIENDLLRVSVKLAGAELVEVFDKHRNQNRMWSGSDSYWGKVSPVLFPIVGRVKDNYTYINGERYEFTQHGFLRDQVFELESIDASRLVMLYESKGRHKASYPFEFEIRISYELQGNTVAINWDVKNLSDTTMLYSIGGHPAFSINPEDDNFFEMSGTKESSLIRLDQAHVSTFEPVSQPITVDVTYDNLKNDAIIYSNIDKVVLKNSTNDAQVIVECEGFDFVGLWANTKHGHMPPFVCIEPWLGITDDIDSDHQFENKRGIRKLSPLSTEKTGYKVEFK